MVYGCFWKALYGQICVCVCARACTQDMDKRDHAHVRIKHVN